MRERKRLRVLELYCGIGGLSAATGSAVEVAAAIDINSLALEVYAENFSHPTVTATIESIPADRLRAWQADLWWMSPPCQPFTRRGEQRDLADPRTKSFLTLIERFAEVRPPYLALENVPEFEDSKTHELLLRTLEALTYEVQSHVLCPTDLGIPNRRRRFYLVAGRQKVIAPRPAQPAARPLAEFLDTAPDPRLNVDPQLVDSYRHALHIVEADDPTAVTSCFTSAYGHSPVRSGSYLQATMGLRRFSPSEILRLLGFQPGFRLPSQLPLRQAWRLVGNSLSIPAVQSALSCVPQLAEFTDREPCQSVASDQDETRPFAP